MLHSATRAKQKATYATTSLHQTPHPFPCLILVDNTPPDTLHNSVSIK